MSRDRDLDKMNSSALESRDRGLEITTLRLGRQMQLWLILLVDETQDVQGKL